MRRGFSLVELSIVLVILGLLVGGILAGKSLIRASEVRGVMKDFDMIVTATNAFKDKYFGLPGDLTNATSFWSGTSNGNGNGEVGWTGESLRYWVHIANAGLVAGSYDGVASAAPTPGTTRPGGNVYASQMTPGSYVFLHSSTYTGIYGKYGNMIRFAANKPSNGYHEQPLLRAEEAWNMDTKMDDGLADGGKLMTYTSWVGGTRCVSGSNAVPGAYNLSSTDIDCLVHYFYN